MTAVPQATYRLQLRAEFGFDDAATVVPYLYGLGISHAYLSPILQAAPGSTHGYDVVDHSRLSEPAGGRPAFDRLAARLADHRMGAVGGRRTQSRGCADAGSAQQGAVVGAAGRAGVAVRRVVRRRLGFGEPAAADGGAGPAHRQGAGGRRAVGRWRRTAVLRARVPAPAGDREPADRGAGDRAVVPPRALAGRGRGAELPALLRRRHPRCGARGDTGGLRRDARAAAGTAARGQAQRLPHRPSGRSGRPARLPASAGRAHRRCVGRGREDPRRRPKNFPTTGPAPAPPGTTLCSGSAASSSTRPVPHRLRPCTPSSPAHLPTSARSWRRRSERSSSTGSTPKCIGWWSCSPRICQDDVRLRDHTRRAFHEVVVELLVALRRLPGVRRTRGTAGADRDRTLWSARPGRPGRTWTTTGRRRWTSYCTCCSARRPGRRAGSTSTRGTS